MDKNLSVKVIEDSVKLSEDKDNILLNFCQLIFHFFFFYFANTCHNMSRLVMNMQVIKLKDTQEINLKS